MRKGDMEYKSVERIPWWAWAAPSAACILLIMMSAGIFRSENSVALLAAAILLAGSVFAAVHHAEVVALRVGEPMGSIVLAVAVTVIEVALIVSLMLSASTGNETFARDTVYSAVMLVLNGVVGFCLLIGGARHHEQNFQAQGATAALGVLGALATITLILPNYTIATPGPLYSKSQLIVVGTISLCLYAMFLFVQTIRHRDYFMTVAPGPGDVEQPHIAPTLRTTRASAALLVLSLVAVVLLAKTLSYPLKKMIIGAGLPQSFVGVVIAGIVLLPEATAAIANARANRLQTSLNLALGSALASIGLTIPAVAVASLVIGQQLALGISAADTVLLGLTLFVSTLTLATGRTTILQGAIHLSIFGVFLFLAAVP
jgi:Ca2+:H+ antiporter